MIAITNSGSDKSSICYEQRSYLVKILQRRVEDDSYFGMIFTIDPEDLDKWDTPEVWEKCQPSLGASVRVAGVERLARKARSMPSARSSFLRYQLGVWAEGEHAWMQTVKWDGCARPDLDMAKLAGQTCYVGLDLASKTDIAAMCAAFRIEGKIILFPRFYVPEARIKDNDAYYGWVHDGHMIATPGETIDFAYIEEDLLEWHKLFDIRGVPYDPWQAYQFATRMEEKKVPMIEFQQTSRKLSEPMKELEALAIDGLLRHPGNPAMDWMVSNVVVMPDRNDNIFPRKEREENKIDGAVAAIMASAMWINQPQPKPSKYADGETELTVIGAD
jgi:phage terminase large subunit-like protein